MTAAEIREDTKTVSEALGVAVLILNGAVKAQPTDLALMMRGRDAFNRLRPIVEAPPPRSHDDIAAARQAHNLSI